MNPLGDNGTMLLGIGQVIVVVIQLFRNKKRGSEDPLSNYRFFVGFVANSMDYIKLETLTRR
jgi:hypothetical protein